MKRDRLLAAAWIAVRAFLVVNIAATAAFVVAIILSFPLAGAIEHVLAVKYAARVDPSAVLLAMRILAVVAVAAGIVLHWLFTALRAIIAAVRAGDPFTLANAARLQSIGWALFGFQLLDLVQGAMTVWFARLHVDFLGWTPSVGGWLAVLLVFVLARVFRVGAQMRDDLAMTV